MRVLQDFKFDPVELEQNEELELVAWCENHGWVIRKIQYVNKRGCPDRLVAGHGRLFLIELKKSDGRLSIHQKNEIRDFGAAGIEIKVFYSAATAIAFLSQFGDDLLV